MTLRQKLFVAFLFMVIIPIFLLGMIIIELIVIRSDESIANTVEHELMMVQTGYQQQGEAVKRGMLQAANTQNIQKAIWQNDKIALQQLLQDWEYIHPQVDLWLITDHQGQTTSQFAKNPLLSKCLKDGIACASVNYPFKKDANYLEIMAQSAESIRLIKTQAEDWNIDPDRIAVMGTSAGAMIAEYLSYWCDMGIAACFADQQPKYSWFLVTPIKKGAPALILYTRSGTRNELHHPKHAKFFKRHCDSVGVKCELYGTKASGLPELPADLAIEDRVTEFFAEQWKQHGPTKSTIKHIE